MMTLKYTLVVIAFCLVGAISAVPSEYSLFDELDDELDEIIEMEPRFSNGNFNGLNRLSDQLRNKIRAVKAWHPVEMDDWNCSALSKVNAVQNGSLELRTPELKRIEQMHVTNDHILRKKYKSIVAKIQFWEKMPFLWASAAMLRKQVNAAESTKKELIKLYGNTLKTYVKAIEERIDHIRGNQMGPELSDILFRGTKINLYSKAEERLLLKSIEAVSKCLKNVNVSDIYRKYQGRATKILNVTHLYQKNDVSDLGFHKRIIYDAILSTHLFQDEEYSRMFFNFFSIQNNNDKKNDNDNDNDDENDNDNANANDSDKNNSNFDDDYNQLPVSPTFEIYVQAIDKAANLIADKRKSNVCKIDGIVANSDDALENRLPSIGASNYLTEDFYNSVQKLNQEIQNKCDLVKNIGQCDKAIRDLRDLLRTKIYEEIVPGYTAAIANLLKDNLGAQIDSNPKAPIECNAAAKLTETKYVLKSSAQLNKAIEIYESATNCLQSFGLNVTKSQMIEKLLETPDFNENLISSKGATCDNNDTLIFTNADNIRSRVSRMQEMYVLPSNWSLFNFIN